MRQIKQDMEAKMSVCNGAITGLPKAHGRFSSNRLSQLHERFGFGAVVFLLDSKGAEVQKVQKCVHLVDLESMLQH